MKHLTENIAMSIEVWEDEEVSDLYPKGIKRYRARAEVLGFVGHAILFADTEELALDSARKTFIDGLLNGVFASR